MDRHSSSEASTHAEVAEARLALRQDLARWSQILPVGAGLSGMAFATDHWFLPRNPACGPLWAAELGRGLTVLGPAVLLVLVRLGALHTERSLLRAERMFSAVSSVGFAMVSVTFLPLLGAANPLTLFPYAIVVVRPSTFAQNAVTNLVALVLSSAVLLAGIALTQHHLPRGATLDQWLIGRSCDAIFALMLALAGDLAFSFKRQVYESRSLGRYELRRRLGRGSMGEVWSAWDRTLNREVALKILKGEGETDEGHEARFEREARAMSELQHPHTVRVFDFGTTDDGIFYYAMELLPGRSLAELLESEPCLAPPRAVALVLQAAHALAEAHARGIVHRDLKPENLFVSEVEGEREFLKVLDFGIARRLNPGATKLTVTGAITGTPVTMSPEAARGDVTTPASDVYGLGVVLFRALAGRYPFEEDNIAKLLLAHLNAEAPAVERFAPVPEALSKLVAACLAKDPRRRPQTGAALARELTALEPALRAWEVSRAAK